MGRDARRRAANGPLATVRETGEEIEDRKELLARLRARGFEVGEQGGVIYVRGKVER